jgi:hypothetical protein
MWSIHGFVQCLAYSKYNESYYRIKKQTYAEGSSSILMF